jgi:hypothetical protein
MATQSQKAKHSKNDPAVPSPFDVEAKAMELFNQGKPYYKPVGGILLAVILISAFVNVQDEGKREHNAQAHLVIQQALALNSGVAAGTPAVFEQQRSQYSKVVKDFADTPGAVDAQFYLARVDLESGNAIAAEAGFKDFLAAHPNHTPFSLMAKLGIANALMSQEKWADAKVQYLAVSEDPAGSEAEFTVKRALYQAGMAALLAGDGPGAEEILNDLRIEVEAREAKEGEDGRYTTLKDDAEDLLAKIKVYSPDALREFVLAPIPEPEPPAPPVPAITPTPVPAPVPGGTPPVPAPVRSQGPPPATPLATEGTPEAATPTPAPAPVTPAPETATPPAPETATPPPATPVPEAATPPAPVPTPEAATPPAAADPAPAK